MLRLLPLSWLLVATSTLASPIAGINGDAFPDLRIYVEAGSPSWVDGQVSVAFADGPSTQQVEAVEALAEAHRVSAGNADLPPLVDLPPASAPGRLVRFADQTAPGEGLLLVLLVDASGSMPGKPIERTLEAVKALTGALRPHDRAAVVSFSTDTEVVLSPTGDAAEVVSSVQGLALDGKVTHIYSAVNQAISVDVPAMRRSMGAEFPGLPHRRIVFVFSDGRDEDSPVPVDDVLDKLDKLDKRGIGLELFAVGVGDRGRRHRDLQRLADGAAIGPHKIQRFFEQPDPAALVGALKALEVQLAEQMRIDLTLPVWYWPESQIEADLKIEIGAGQVKSIPVTLVSGASSADQRRRAAEYRTALDAAVAWHEAERERSSTTRLVTIAALALALLIVMGLLIRRAFARSNQAQEVALANANDRLAEQLRAVEGRIDESEQVLQQELGRVGRSGPGDEQRQALASLLAIDGPLKGRRYAITRSPCVVGRSADCAIVFPPDKDRGISREHAQFRLDSDGMWSVTCLARGGLGVNGQGVPHGDSYRLRPNDRIQLGSTVLRFGGPA